MDTLRAVPSRFDADQVGICLATLHFDERQLVAADVERLTRVAAAAGFPSLALKVNWVRTYGVDATRALLDEVGLTAGALESAMTWPDGPEAAVEQGDPLLDVASALGAGVLHAATLAVELDSARATEGFAALCERARAHNIDVSLEFIPTYAVPDLETAWQIVRGSGAGNGGICIDFMHWHYQPGGPDFNQLRDIPGERITYVQPTDAPSTVSDTPAEYLAECVTLRPVPGDGVVDVDAMVAALSATTADPYIAYQVCNTAMAATPDAMAARLRANASTLFA